MYKWLVRFCQLTLSYLALAAHNLLVIAGVFVSLPMEVMSTHTPSRALLISTRLKAPTWMLCSGWVLN